MSTILRHMMWPWCKFKMQVWNVLRAARCKCRTQKIAKKSPSGHHRTTLSGYIFATKAHIDNRKQMLSNDMSSTCPHNMVNFGLLTAEIRWRVWGTPANFNGVRVLATLLHGTLVVGVSQTLRQGGDQLGHWPTFLVKSSLPICLPIWWIKIIKCYTYILACAKHSHVCGALNFTTS